MARWLRTDETEEALAGLESLAKFCKGVGNDLYEWRWVVLAAHNALQGFMVLSLRSSEGLLPLKDDIAAKWLEAYQTGGKYPEERLDSFLNLYKKIQSERMRRFLNSESFVPVGTQTWSVRKLNALRNKFIHFLPQSWSLEVSGLPAIVLDCLATIEFLSFESGAILWHEESYEARVNSALMQCRDVMCRLEQEYAMAT